VLALDLRRKEANTACHLFDTADFSDKGALEGVYVGIELRSPDAGSEGDGVKRVKGERTSLNSTLPSSPSSDTVS
jgi:hypothetical protein